MVLPLRNKYESSKATTCVQSSLIDGIVHSAFSALVRYGGGGAGAGGCEASFADLIFAVSDLHTEYGGGGGVCRLSSSYKTISSQVSESANFNGAEYGSFGKL